MQQAKMAQYCRDIFKEKLLVDPLDNFPVIIIKFAKLDMNSAAVNE